MKKIFLLLILLIIKEIYSLELISETQLKPPEKYSFSEIYYADYNLNKKELLLTVDIPEISSNYQGENPTENIFRGVFVYSKWGKLLGKVGKFNSYDKDGIIAVFSTRFYGETINIYDSKKGELMLFDNEQPFNYCFTVKSPETPLWCIPSVIENKKVISLMTEDIKDYHDKNGELLTDIDKFMRISIADLKDSQYEGIKEVTNVKKIFSYKKQFYDFWYDKRMLKNRFIKHILKKWDDQSQNFSFLMLHFANKIGPNFYKNHVILGKKEFFLCNSYADEIVEYNFNGDSLATYQIEKYANLKNEEINQYKNLFSKKIKNKKQLKTFTKRYQISSLQRILYDSNGNNIILSYNGSELFQAIGNLPKAKQYLLVYSLDKRKAVSDFIPINFTPIQFDSEKRELIGGQQRDGDIYLQFYKWEIN